MMTRRQALKAAACATAACATSTIPVRSQGKQVTATATAAAIVGPHTLPALAYAFDALEPHIDARTMEIHHDKHHASYVTNLNKVLLENGWGLGAKNLERWLGNLNIVPEKFRTVVRNNGGGHYNHSLFWQMMKKNGGGEPKAELAKAIEKNFGNFTDFKTKFTEAAMKVFGSGWAWLVSHEGKLAIESTPNQDTPLSTGKQPLLGLDVWEHAYYLKYQNRRADYIAAWWNVVNWDFVAERYADARK